jgi:hypothetical protein
MQAFVGDSPPHGVSIAHGGDPCRRKWQQCDTMRLTFNRDLVAWNKSSFNPRELEIQLVPSLSSTRQDNLSPIDNIWDDLVVGTDLMLYLDRPWNKKRSVSGNICTTSSDEAMTSTQWVYDGGSMPAASESTMYMLSRGDVLILVRYCGRSVRTLYNSYDGIIMAQVAIGPCRRHMPGVHEYWVPGLQSWADVTFMI